MTPFYLLIILFISPKFCFCLEFFSGIATAVGLGAIASYNLLKCKQFECCSDEWIHFDESKLAENFKRNLFGQHLVYSTISKSLKGFLNKKNPQKALVMSFNGPTGSGKNYVATMIANSTYKEGMRSSFVHFYSGVRHFPHRQRVAYYQDKLREDIAYYTKECDRSLFIFDEVDKMPPGTLDALRPYIEYNQIVDGVDYRKNIFIFLSNTGSNSIISLVLRYWANGIDREEITMRDIEPIVNKGAFNEDGGLQYSELLRSELVDLFVPFLPLEKKHVKQCIEAELKDRGASYNQMSLDTIADDMVYFPEEEFLFSKSGCKRIAQKVDLYLN